ncbi:MAG: GAF domain-containing protein [Flavobacterium sp.]|nr:GAF domain-containing protein [Flavobacterium sp.]
MKIRDIVNRDIVNLTNCEHEPIHIPGSIQPHGFLIAIDSSTLQITFCSQNVTEFIGLTPAEILSEHISKILPPDLCSRLSNIATNSTAGHPIRSEIRGHNFSCHIHRSAENIIIEAEPELDESVPLADIYDQTSRFLSYMNQTSTLQELCDMVARETRQITGYDRVMIYRFDSDYNGEIISEALRDDLEPFLGLHYPHTDIPVQARQLYLKNLLRIISDINYTPVPIYTIDNNQNTNLDLSHSVLRSTSPIHVQYLQNMGVGATLTISLIHQGRLWGLIACHHYSPKIIKPEIRLAAQLQGHFITSQIDVRQSNEEYKVSLASNAALEKLTAIELGAEQHDFNKLLASDAILTLCNAAGAAIIFNGHIYKRGMTPSDEGLLTLATAISSISENSSFHTEKLQDYLPEYGDLCKQVAGVLYHSLAPEGPNSIMWFRPETLNEVHWAGDPSKAIIKDKNGLSPRNSFDLWKEIVQCVSKPWLAPELNAAANYANLLQKHATFLVLSLEETKYRQLSEILKETNSELENINWISTHDLQEPLRKMQLISSRILMKEKETMSDKVIESLNRINSSASRMQKLLIDILKYTRINHAANFSEAVSLNSVMDSVLLDIDDVINDKEVQISVAQLPVIRAVPFLVKQVFLNLILNSVKYAKDTEPPVIKITAEKQMGTSGEDIDVIIFEDNGIGFDPQFATSIFNIFSRLHSQGEYSGSGVGLALCKKIMQAHGGRITAEALPNEGATFRLFFPANIPA